MEWKRRIDHKLRLTDYAKAGPGRESRRGEEGSSGAIYDLRAVEWSEEERARGADIETST